MDKVEIELLGEPRQPTQATAALVRKIEARSPDLVRAAGLSTAGNDLSDDDRRNWIQDLGTEAAFLNGARYEDSEEAKSELGRIEGVLRRRAARNGLTLEAQIEADRNLFKAPRRLFRSRREHASLAGMEGVAENIFSAPQGPIHLVNAGGNETYPRDALSIPFDDPDVLDIFGPPSGKQAFAGINLADVANQIREIGAPIDPDAPRGLLEKLLDPSSAAIGGVIAFIFLAVVLRMTGVLH